MIQVNKTTRWVAKPRGHGGRSKVVYEASLGDLRVDGNTAAEAKAKLLERAELMLRGEDCPYLIRRGEWTAFVWRRGTEWGYRLVEPIDNATLSDDRYERTALYTTNHSSRQEAENAAMYHLAQTVFNVRHPYEALEHIDDREERAKFLSWASWHLRYAALDAAGYDGRCHEAASGLERWPKHIERPADLVDPLVGHALVSSMSGGADAW